MILPSSSYGLDVGGMTLNSAINQKLDARIALLSVKPSEVSAIKASLASEAIYAAKSLKRSALLKSIRLTIKSPIGLPPYIHLTSDQVITESVLNLLVSIRWNKNQLMREFFPLFDPPSSLVYYAVLKNETIWHIAEKMRPDNISVEQMMLALQRENPDAFYGNNVSLLMAGAVLRIEDTSVLSDVPPAEAAEEISRQYKRWLTSQRGAIRAASRVARTRNADRNPQKIEPINLASQFAKLEDKVAMIERLIQSKEESNTEREKTENEALWNRISTLEAQMSAVHDLIRLNNAVARESANAGPVFEKVFPDNMQKNRVEEPPLWAQVYTYINTFRDPKQIAGIIFVASSLVLLIWFLAGRLRAIDRSVVFAQEKQHAEDKYLQEDDVDTGAKIELDVIRFNKTMTENTELKRQPDSVEEAGSDYLKILETNEVTLAPLAEADVYLTYEKYEKAEHVLRKAIGNDPHKQELQLKLLEVYALSRNVFAFDHQADVLFYAINQDENNTLWQHALLMAEDIETRSPLFQREQSVADSPSLAQNQKPKDVALSDEE